MFAVIAGELGQRLRDVLACFAARVAGAGRYGRGRNTPRATDPWPGIAMGSGESSRTVVTAFSSGRGGAEPAQRRQTVGGRPGRARRLMDESAKPASPRSGATLPGGCQVAKQSPTRLRDYHPIVSELPYTRPNRTSTKANLPQGTRPVRPAKNGQSMRRNCATNVRNGQPSRFREADLLKLTKRDPRPMPRKGWKLLSRSRRGG